MSNIETTSSLQQKSTNNNTRGEVNNRNNIAKEGENLPQNNEVQLQQAEHDVINSEDVQAVFKEVEQYVQSYQRDLHFEIDKELNKVVVKVLDANTKEVIRQIPQEHFLKMARNLRNNSLSLINTKV